MKRVTAKLSAILALLPIGAFAQSWLPAQDAYVVPGSATNFGSAPNITIGSSSSAGLVQFDLSTLPPGTLASQIQKASLAVYVNHVSTPGSMNIFMANGAWTEFTVSGVNAPAPGSTLASSIPVTVSGQFINLDVTSAVQAWLSQPSNNNGFLIQGNGGASFQIDSKEATSTSHAAMLSVTLANSGPQGLAGAKGAVGATGPTGPQGPAGAAGVLGYQIVSTPVTIPQQFAYLAASSCPTGKVVLSGGLSFDLTGLSSSDIESIFLSQSYPSSTTAWSVVLINHTAKSLSGVAYVVCSN